MIISKKVGHYPLMSRSVFRDTWLTRNLLSRYVDCLHPWYLLKHVTRQCITALRPPKVILVESAGRAGQALFRVLATQRTNKTT